MSARQQQLVDFGGYCRNRANALDRRIAAGEADLARRVAAGPPVEDHEVTHLADLRRERDQWTQEAHTAAQLLDHDADDTDDEDQLDLFTTEGPTR